MHHVFDKMKFEMAALVHLHTTTKTSRTVDYILGIVAQMLQYHDMLFDVLLLFWHGAPFTNMV